MNSTLFIHPGAEIKASVVDGTRWPDFGDGFNDCSVEIASPAALRRLEEAVAAIRRSFGAEADEPRAELVDVYAATAADR